MLFKDATSFISANPLYFVVGFSILLLITYAIVINLWMDISQMKKRYRKMMTGVEGGNLERMINGHIEEVEMVVSEQKELHRELERVDEILAKAITKTAIVRYDAFDEMANDLSYCIAMLDSNDNGIVITGIFGREDSRTYAKPIVKGESSYKLTPEEERALKEAMRQR